MGAIFMGDSKASDSRIDAGLLLTNNSLDNFDILKLIQDYKIENGIANDEDYGFPSARRCRVACIQTRLAR